VRQALAAAVLAAIVLAGCSGGGSRDSDGDGLRDDEEKRGWTITVDLLDRRIEREVTADPKETDTDRDGLTDFEEFSYLSGLDPRNPDTDEDGLTDCQEDIHRNLTQCQDPAFTGPFDGGYGTDPARADSDPGPTRYVNNLQGFQDETGSLSGPVGWGDGLADGVEVTGYFVELQSGARRYVQTDPLEADTDGDLLEDGEEVLAYYGDPLTRDTDGDGCEDGRDPLPDREDEYLLGLQTFTLLKDMDGPGQGADLRLRYQVGGRQGTAPPAEGSMQVQAGEASDIAVLDPGILRPTGCDLTPWNPWALLQVFAFDLDGPAQEDIDIDSESRQGLPRGGPSVYWNVRDGTFSWAGPDESAFQGVVEFEGAEGRLALQPTLG
jgi:hypothetical protein